MKTYKKQVLDIHGFRGAEVEVISVQSREVWVQRVIGVAKAQVAFANVQFADGKTDFRWIFEKDVAGSPDQAKLEKRT